MLLNGYVNLLLLTPALDNVHYFHKHFINTNRSKAWYHTVSRAQFSGARLWRIAPQRVIPVSAHLPPRSGPERRHSFRASVKYFAFGIAAGWQSRLAAIRAAGVTIGLWGMPKECKEKRDARRLSMRSNPRTSLCYCSLTRLHHKETHCVLLRVNKRPEK